MKNFLFLLYCSIILFYSCSASTDTRYKTAEELSEEEEIINETPSNVIVEDFDFTPYRTVLDIPVKEINIPVTTKNSDVWYGYEESENDTSLHIKKIIDKVPGYRVLLLTTDNLEEANALRAEIDSSSVRREVYIVFDPPFYKVMLGDFQKFSEAKDLSFKMNQLGYPEARVVNETINIYDK